MSERIERMNTSYCISCLYCKAFLVDLWGFIAIVNLKYLIYDRLECFLLLVDEETLK